MFTRYIGGLLRLKASPRKLAKNILLAVRLAPPKLMCKATSPSLLKENSKKHWKSLGETSLYL